MNERGEMFSQLRKRGGAVGRGCQEHAEKRKGGKL